MSPHRKYLALLILAVIVIGQSFDIVLQREDWPFSNYPMYARLIRKKETSLLRLYGQVTDGKKTWIMPIVDDNRVMYVPPLNELTMKNILDYAWSRGGEQATQHVLRDYMVLYEQRRILGQHATSVQGPRMLDAICMKLTWKLDARAGRIGKPTIEPLVSTTRPAIDSEAAQ